MTTGTRPARHRTGIIFAQDGRGTTGISTTSRPAISPGHAGGGGRDCAAWGYVFWITARPGIP